MQLFKSTKTFKFKTPLASISQLEGHRRDEVQEECQMAQTCQASCCPWSEHVLLRKYTGLSELREKISDFLVRMVVLGLMRTVMTPPAVSILSKSGATSRRRSHVFSEVSLDMIAAWHRRQQPRQG